MKYYAPPSRSVPCPYCEVPAGRRCVTSTGNSSHESHALRRDRARLMKSIAEDLDLPGMWETADLAGGQTDALDPILEQAKVAAAEVTAKFLRPELTRLGVSDPDQYELAWEITNAISSE